MIHIRSNTREILARRGRIQQICGAFSESPTAQRAMLESSGFSSCTDSRSGASVETDPDEDVYCPSWLKDRPGKNLAEVDSPVDIRASILEFVACLQQDISDMESLVGQSQYLKTLNDEQVKLLYGAVYSFIDDASTVVGPSLDKASLATEIGNSLNMLIDKVSPGLLRLHRSLPLVRSVIEAHLPACIHQAAKNLVVRPLEQVSRYPRFLTGWINALRVEKSSEHAKYAMHRALRGTNRLLEQIRHTKVEEMITTWEQWRSRREEDTSEKAARRHDCGGTLEFRLSSADDIQLAGCKIGGGRSEPSVQVRSHYQGLAAVGASVHDLILAVRQSSRTQHRCGKLWRHTSGEQPGAGHYITSMYQCYEECTESRLALAAATARRYHHLADQITQVAAMRASHTPAMDRHLAEVAWLVGRRYVQISQQWCSGQGPPRRYTAPDITRHYEQSLASAWATFCKM